MGGLRKRFQKMSEKETSQKKKNATFPISYLVVNTQLTLNMEQVKSSITLKPKPGFVVKTKILESSNFTKYGVSTKVFINICHDEQVPKPELDFDPSIVFPLIIKNEWEIPLIVSQEKLASDKKGIPSYVYDCCINNRSFQWCQVNQDLRSILIEWCIESIELLYELTLEREYSIPKMLSKGELSNTIIQEDELSEDGFQKKLQQLKSNEVMGLIEEMRHPEEEENYNGDLPDLMNIDSKDNIPRKKPLIEEISDMKISSKLNKQNQSKMDIDSVAKPLIRQKINFTLKYPPVHGDKYQYALQLQSDQLDGRNLRVSFNKELRHVLVENTNKNIYFKEQNNGKPDCIELPLPPSTTTSHSDSSSSYKCFFVESENCLYCFV